MAVDKLVDSAQLDADLTAVANAIRTKGGTSAQLAFPAGFVSAVEAIETGGGDANENLVKRITNTLTICDVDLNGLEVRENALRECTNLVGVHMRNAGNIGGNVFYNCRSLEYIVFRRKTSGRLGSYFVGQVALANLAIIDLEKINQISGYAFDQGTALATLILRSESVPTLDNVSAFNRTPFASGGTGGTIYISESLYNHLGDGGSLDYKAATNWSAVDGRGTITWRNIKGSQYENYYADGTPIAA